MERLGRYRIDRELGRGSMSIVYRAFDPRIDRYLAVKVLKQKYASDLNCRQRFLREARAAGGLSHPNIVTVFDVGQADGTPYMAMEILEGETLADRLDSKKTLSLSEVLDLAIQTTSALTYAHERGIVHRDVKPANIHYDRDTRVAKLMDFGIADIGNHSRQPVTRRGEVLGTPAYMAPEQIMGRELDGRCDLYSMGVLIYHLLSGKEPYRAEKLSDLLVRIVHEPPESLEPTDPDTPVELIELVERLLAKNPAARFRQGSQVLEELQDIRLAYNRDQARPSTWYSMAWRWPVTVAAVVAIVLGGGLFLIHHQQTRAMAEVTYGYGEAMASIVAQEIAEPLILDDSAALSTLMGDFAGNPRVQYLHLVDRNDRVRASTDTFLEGNPPPEPEGRELDWGSSSLRLLEVSREVVEFKVPVRFQARRIGEIRLGLDTRDMSAVAGSTLRMMTLLFLVTVLAALLGIHVLARRLSASTERLGWGLGKIGRGHYDFRLEERRRNELGTIYQRFNDMVTRLEERHGTGIREERREARIPVVGEEDDNETAHAETLDLSPGQDEVSDGHGTGQDLADEDPAQRKNPEENKVTRLKPTGKY